MCMKHDGLLPARLCSLQVYKPIDSTKAYFFFLKLALFQAVLWQQKNHSYTPDLFRRHRILTHVLCWIHTALTPISKLKPREFKRPSQGKSRYRCKFSWPHSILCVGKEKDVYIRAVKIISPSSCTAPKKRKHTLCTKMFLKFQRD